MSGVHLVGLVAALVTVTIVLELVRRRQLREKYAVLWLLLGIGTSVFGFFPRLLFAAADLLGVYEPANLLFFGAIVVLLGVVVQLSWEVSRLENETRTLAESVALLRHDVEELRQGRGGQDPSSSSNVSSTIADGRAESAEGSRR